MGDSPQRIWIEAGDDCPYFYEESELADVGSPVTEYIRADLCHRTALEPSAADMGNPITDKTVKRRVADALESVWSALDCDVEQIERVIAHMRANGLRIVETVVPVSDGVDTIEVGIPATEQSTASKMEVVAETVIPVSQPSAARELALEAALRKMVALYESEYDADVPFKRPDWLVAALSPPDHADAGKVEGDGSRWRVFEAAVGGYWGIELEQASNDDDPILYPIKVHRDTLARIVDAHNAALPSAPSEGAE